MTINEHQIRVLRLIARMNIGGPAIQISGLMRNLDHERFEQKLITGFCDDDELDYLDQKSLVINVDRVRGLGRKIGFVSDLRAFLEIRRTVKRFKPDIVHTHTAKAGFLGRIASISLHKRPVLVHTYHGHLLSGYFSALKTKLVVIVEKLLALYTDVLIAVGNQVRDDLIEAGIGNFQQFEVIGPGLVLDVLPERRKIEEQFGLSKGLFTIGWVGRVTDIKAPLRVIELAREFAQRKEKLRFVVAGDGPLLNSLKDTALKEGLPIIFLGWQPNIEPILAITDIMLLTSLNEGTPVSLIEAQMAGIPALATNVGSVSEVISHEKTGYCLDYSVKDFAKIIMTIKGDEALRKSLGQFARQRSAEVFSLDRLVRDHQKLYIQLCQEINPPNS